MDKLITFVKENKKKTILIGCIILLVIIFLIVGSVVLVQIFKRYDYHEIENIMVTSTKEYLQKNSFLLPTSEEPETVIDASSLISEKYMKEFSKLSKDPSCTGEVKVSYNNGFIRYEPQLACQNYSSISLKDTILNNEEIKEDDDGLYQLNTFYTYRGEYVNNYLNFAGDSFRILKFDDEKMYLILADTANELEQAIYDDRYNEMIHSNRGYNNFESSRIEENLLGIFESFFANYKNYLVPMDACTHTRSETDFNNTGEIECTTTYKTPISLLATYDYINASIDPLCKTITSGNCANYNYLAKATNKWWLLNGTNENSYEVYAVNVRGAVNLEHANTKKYLRVVIAIPSDVLYKQGDGTASNPYEFYLF